MTEKNWIYERLHKTAALGLKIKKKIYDTRSKYQHIQIFDTYAFGRLFVLDGIFQTTEKDEFVYHEMLVHPIFLSMPFVPKRVLIIGGGDGGVAREVMKYPCEEVHLVEIDEKVVKIAQKYLRKICGRSFEDPRLKIIIQDGAKFVKETDQQFDAIIVDSSDPVGPNKSLFTASFYREIKRILKPEGLVSRQTGSSFLQPMELPRNYKILKNIFRIVRVYTADTPTYWGGLFTYVCASDKTDPTKVGLEDIERKFNELGLKTKYYTPLLHQAAFVVPRYVSEKLKQYD